MLGAGALAASPGMPAAAQAPAEATQRVIVEFAAAPAIKALSGAGGNPLALAAKRSLVTAQRSALAQAKRRGIRTQDERSLTTLINGVALRTSRSDVDRLRRLPGVVAVHRDQPMRASTDVSVPLIGAHDVWKRTDPHGKPARGRGVTVAVIDTGVDYTHPSLGGGLGAGRKVVGGHDFVNDDADPMDDNAHGTHVAGIIAGNGEAKGAGKGVTGVAPDAQLTAYKVLDDNGEGYESAIIAGLEAAVDPANPHRADVVNLSLGGYGDGTDPIGRAATAAAAAGVMVIAAAGNSGPGAQTVGTPAAAEGVIAVGASTSGLSLPSAYLSAQNTGEKLMRAYRVPFSANPPARPMTGAVVDVGEGTPADYAKAGDVRGKVVLYAGGAPGSPSDVSADDLQRARDAEQRGAIAAIGYSTDASPLSAARPGEVQARAHGLASGDSLRMDRLVVLGIDGDQYAAVKQSAQPRVTIKGTDVTDQIASFSSRGPSARYTLKPDLVAPGVEIRSTVPKAMWEPGEYRMSGTSMASPQVAGAAALLRQLRPAQPAARLTAALVNSAKPLTGTGPMAQGAGRLDVRAAADGVLTASPATLSFGLADLSRPTLRASATVRLHNAGGRPVTATLRGGPAPGSPGRVRVSRERVTVPAGGSVAVTVNVSAPNTGAPSDVAGWITADLPGDAPDVRIPYLLSARPLIVQASPDPSDGTSTVFVHSALPLAQPPVITVTPRKGRPTEVTGRLVHGTWYRVDVRVERAGVYRLTARARTGDHKQLVGAASFEVVPVEHRGTRGRWAPIGPNSTSGELATTPAPGGLGVMTNYGATGVWITGDKGKTWRQQNRLPVAGGTGSVIVDQQNPDRMWYAVNGSTGNAVWDPTYQGKILRSTDRGRTWTTLDFPDVHVEAFAGDPGGGTLAAVTADAILISQDRGQSWTSHAANWGDGSVQGASIARGNLYVATTDGIWMMRDLTGEPTSAELVFSVEGTSLFGIDASPHVVAAVTFNGTVTGSHDGGRTWRTLYKTPSRGGFYVRVVGSDVFVNGLGEDYVGRDHGRAWSTLKAPVPAAVDVDFDRWPGDDRTLVVSAQPAGLYATTDDGASYRRIGVQGHTASALAVTQDAKGAPTLLAGTDAGVYRTPLPTGPPTDATAEWGASGGEGMVGLGVPLLQTSPREVKVVWRVLRPAIGNFRIERSDDGGTTWSVRGTNSQYPDALLVHTANPDHVAVAFHRIGQSGVHVTRDGGKTWKTHLHPMVFDAVAADPRSPDRLWLGSSAGLYRSDDFGATITKVLDGRVTAISTDPAAPQRVVAAGDVIRVSTDRGRTFTTADTGDLRMRVSAVVNAPRALYAGTTTFVSHGLNVGGRGVLRSTDDGRTWVNISGGLQNLAVASLALSTDGRWLFAGTENGGAHRLKLR
jgi:subtilisin family serine protease